MVLLLDGSIELDESLFEVRRHGAAVPMEPQAFDVLVHLVHHRDRVVAKEELMDVVWGGRFVTEAAVTSRIKQVRRALGDDGHTQRLVRTLHGRGYRFLGEVREVPAGHASAPAVPTAGEQRRPRAPVRYTTSDGLHIAYQVTGGGDLDIVLISGFVSHLDIDWDDPRHAYFLERLGRSGRLIRFDKRGTGMSDRPAGVPDLETRMHDVLAVMDAAGSDRAVLCGYSEGGPMATLLAVTHPERVAGLVLYGTYARRLWAEDYPWGETPEERRAHTDRLVGGWDWAADLRFRCPSGDRDMEEWWTRRMTAAATPGTVRALMDMNSLVDVRSVLPSIAVPTLVVHRTGDALLPAEGARYLAEHIPGARLELIPGADHFVSGDPAQLLDVFEPFLAALPAPAHRHALAAVVAVGGADRDAAVEALVAAGGRRRTAAAGDPVVLFDGPATAVRAATATHADHPGAGMGLAIAEVAVDGGPVSGPGVDVAVELASAAGAGRVLVSAPAAALLAGSGIVLSDAELPGNLSGASLVVP